MGRVFFLTGVTGFLGAEIASLLGEDPEDRVYCLIRGGDPESAKKRLAEILDQYTGLGSDQFVAVDGDLRRSDLGVEPALYDRLTREVSHIIHSAADVRFNVPLEKIRGINVDGTRTMLDFAMRCQERNSAFSHLDYVSTAYVGGRSRGVVGADELRGDSGFKNSYEQSKFEAERLVREHFDRLPIIVYRPSIILGSTANGRARRHNAIYPMLRIIHDWPLPFVSARWNARLDLVPIDFAARALLHISSDSGNLGHGFYLASGHERDLTIARFCRVVGKEFGRVFINVPHVIYYYTFWQAVRLLKPEIASRSNALDAFDPYIHQAGPRFDTRSTETALAGTGLALPDTVQYLRTCCRYAITTDFGANPERYEGREA